jgi:hypothetical protein
MLRNSYPLFETDDSTFLLVSLEDFQQVFTPEDARSTFAERVKALALADKSGAKWLPLAGKEIQQIFLKRLALDENTTQATIRKRITRHKISDFAELIFFLKFSNAPDSLEEIDRWNRRNEAGD